MAGIEESGEIPDRDDFWRAYEDSDDEKTSFEKIRLDGTNRAAH